MSDGRCRHCGSTNVKAYTIKPPPPKRNGFHRCDASCIKPAILRLNCRMGQEIHEEEIEQ